MIANLFGTTATSPSTSAANFVPFHSQAATPTATETARLQVLGAAVTLGNFFVSVNNAPGTAASGKQYVFTVRKNQVDTAATVTIFETATSAVYSGAGVSFAAGDTISLGITPTNTPTAPTLTYWNIQADSGGTDFAPLVGGAAATAGLSTSVNSFNNLFGDSGATSWNATESVVEIIAPCAGTINNLYIIADAAAGSGKTWAITLVQNTTPTSLTASFSGTTAKTGNDTTHSVSINAGDTLSIQATPTSTPTVSRISWGLEFTPTTPGQSFFGFGSSTAPSTTTTQYETALGVGQLAYSGTETTRQIMPGSGIITTFYAQLGTAPGGATTRTLTLRKNAASTSVAVGFTGAAVTGNITGQAVRFEQTDLLSLQAAETGTPAADTGGVQVGILMLSGLVVAVSDSTTVTTTVSTFSTELYVDTSNSVTVTPSIIASLLLSPIVTPGVQDINGPKIWS